MYLGGCMPQRSSAEVSGDPGRRGVSFGQHYPVKDGGSRIHVVSRPVPCEFKLKPVECLIVGRLSTVHRGGQYLNL